MIKLKIIGNRKSFQVTNEFKYIEISLSGAFEPALTNFIILRLDGQEVAFDNKQKLFNLSEAIKGATPDELFHLLLINNIDPAFVHSLFKNNSIEIGLFKSILLIFNYIQSRVIAFTGSELINEFSNQLIVDWRYKLGPQNEIYFIDKRYTNKNNDPLIKRLVQLNLLYSFVVSDNDFILLETYFIPLIKPGVTRNNFISDIDETGERTYDLWKKILKDRDIKMTNLLKNKF